MRDHEFNRGKNPMTKMEIRNTIISYLELENASKVLDIGAGTGSVTVQIAKTNTNLDVYGIEKTTSGCELIKENALKHKVKITVIEDEAPSDLLSPDLRFDRVYLGGTGKRLEAIMSWLENDRLANGALIVFSVITLESLSEITTYLNNKAQTYHHVEGSLIQASRLEPLGSYHYFKPLNPCYIIKCQFGGEIHD